MMRHFSDTEKKILERIVSIDHAPLELADFIEAGFPGGAIEISSFQQRLVIEPGGQVDVSGLTDYLLEVIHLIEYLESQRLVRSWSYLPLKDNLRQIGSAIRQPQFLPDFSVASKVLQLAGRLYTPCEALQELVKNGFRSRASRSRHRLLTAMIAGFFILTGTGIAAIYADYQLMNQDTQIHLDRMEEINQSIRHNQQLNRAILDSIHWQSSQLMVLSLETSRNTEKIRDLKQKLDIHHRSLRKLRQNQQGIRQMMVRNQQLLTETDSIIREWMRK